MAQPLAAHILAAAVLITGGAFCATLAVGTIVLSASLSLLAYSRLLSDHAPPAAFLSSTGRQQRPQLRGVARGQSAGSRTASGAARRKAQSAEGTTRGTAFGAPALAASLPWLVELATRRRVAQRRATAVRRAASATNGAEGPSWEAEVAALEHGAEQLRLEAAKIEADMEKQRQQEQAKWFRIFDASGSGAVGVKDLQKGMFEFSGTRLDEDMAERLLLAHDVNRDGVLQLTEFDLRSFEVTLEGLRAADHLEATVAQRAARERMALRQRQVQQARELARYYASLKPANEDTGALTRVASALVYVLPLLDGLRFGVPLLAATADPVLTSAFDLLLPFAQALHTVPLAQLFVFVTLQTLADNTKLPVLLRFNMRQAAVLDIVVGALQLLEVAASVLSFGHAPPGLIEQWDSNAIVFLLLLGCIAYAMGSSLLGSFPDRVPGISAYTTRYMVPTRPAYWPGRTTEDSEKPRGTTPAESEGTSRE